MRRARNSFDWQKFLLYLNREPFKILVTLKSLGMSCNVSSTYVMLRVRPWGFSKGDISKRIPPNFAVAKNSGFLPAIWQAGAPQTSWS